VSGRLSGWSDMSTHDCWFSEWAIVRVKWYVYSRLLVQWVSDCQGEVICLLTAVASVSEHYEYPSERVGLVQRGHHHHHRHHHLIEWNRWQTNWSFGIKQQSFTHTYGPTVRGKQFIINKLY